MYPQVDKNQQMPTAPPPYSESSNAQKYGAGPAQYPPQYPSQSGQQHQQQPPQVIVVQGAGIPPLGPHSVEVACPSCKAFVRTTTVTDPATSAYLCCLFMCLIGFVCCSCLPFCMDNFKKTTHTCPRCNAFIGLYQS